MTAILKIDASMRHTGSVTRELGVKVLERLVANDPGATITYRDLADPVPQIDAAWIGANFTDAADRGDAQRNALTLSDRLVAELKAADILILAVPMYNFGVPAAFKAWIDQIARTGVTFRYTESGPVGLLEGKQAILVTASGGTDFNGPMDFSTPYIRQILGFVGITDVVVVAADRAMLDADLAVSAALSQIKALAA